VLGREKGFVDFFHFKAQFCCWAVVAVLLKGKVEMVQTFLDQIDADFAAIKWLNSRPGVNRVERHNHSSGRTCSAWAGTTLLATTVVVRDELNRSILVCHDLREDGLCCSVQKA
jgi:hypothetical protein